MLRSQKLIAKIMNLNSVLLQKQRENYCHKSSGFTLIELLVTLIIVGVLGAVALPNFLNQIGKARESETKATLGFLGRSQQAYHFQNQTFASNISLLTNGLNSTVDTKYHSFPDPTTVNDSLVKHQAIALNPIQNQVRNFAVGAYFNAGAYDISICQSAEINIPVDVGDTPVDNCTNNGIRLK